MDILGAHGWEVITVTGAIGGDQQVMLKRLYDKSRTEAELKEIDENSALAMQGFLDSLIAEDKAKTKTESLAESKAVELIELDSLEARQKQEMEDAENTAQLNEIADNYVNSLTQDKPIAWSTSYSRDSPRIFLTYDLTRDYLLNGNAYRKSQVNEFLKSLDPMLKTIPQLAGKDIDVRITANIVYNGKTFKVGSATYGKEYPWSRSSVRGFYID